MGKLSFNTIGEPRSMYPFLEVLSDAQRSFNATRYVIPAELQTLDYAAAVLAKWNPPQLSVQRGENRIGRVQTITEAGVTVYALTTEAALRNLHTVGGNRGVLLGLMDHLESLVQADIRAGDASATHAGIIPAAIVEPLPDQMPSGISYNSPKDVSLVETPARTYVLGPDQYEVDDIETVGPRGEVVNLRRQLLGQWMADAAFGAGALQLVQDSRAALLAA